jgi:hypothetical protein
MSNGYLVAAEADIDAAREIGDGFELDVIDLRTVENQDAVAAALIKAANVGLLLSDAATRDAAFFALLQALALRLPQAQLILVDTDALSHFGFLPRTWPAMPLDEARRRASELVRRREPAPAPAAAPEPDIQPAQDDERVRGITVEPAQAAPSTPESDGNTASDALAAPQLAPATEPPAPPVHVDPPAEFAGESPAELQEETPPTRSAKIDPPPADLAAPQAESTSPPSLEADASASESPVRFRKEEGSTLTRAGGAVGGMSAAAATSYTADASAFAPKKLRRGTPELVRVVIHQPQQLKDVIKAAKKIDPRAEATPQGMRVGDIAAGESVGVSLDVRGATCAGAMQRRTWNGEPIDFSFTLEAEAGVKQAVILARVFVGDAQVGVIGFTRAISGPAKKAASVGDARLKRHKRVFLSYSSQDRATVAAIATAYEAAGIPHFWDRASLKSGEEWSPRLRKEIDSADLFHLCWSKAAAQSQWVEKEAEHALTRRKRSNGKSPDITVQMLDGPPWAPHPANLDSINFDDFVRAAIVGYARGDGGDAA